MKKISLIILVACSIVLLFSFNAKAANAWYHCTVGSAGTSGAGSDVVIFLTDKNSSFTSQSFVARTGREKEQLAIALTAMASSLQVKVYCDPTQTNLLNRIIQNIYLETP